ESRYEGGPSLALFFRTGEEIALSAAKRSRVGHEHAHAFERILERLQREPRRQPSLRESKHAVKPAPGKWESDLAAAFLGAREFVQVKLHREGGKPQAARIEP